MPTVHTLLFLQRPSVNFDKVWAPVVEYTTLRTLLAVVAAKDLELEQIDVKAAFLNGALEEDIYMCQPPGHRQGGPEMVCKLMALRGLKQVCRAWHVTFKQYLEAQGVSATQGDPSLYILRTAAGHVVHLLVYVDDPLVAAQLPENVAAVKAYLLVES